MGFFSGPLAWVIVPMWGRLRAAFQSVNYPIWGFLPGWCFVRRGPTFGHRISTASVGFPFPPPWLGNINGSKLEKCFGCFATNSQFEKIQKSCKLRLWRPTQGRPQRADGGAAQGPGHFSPQLLFLHSKIFSCSKTSPGGYGDAFLKQANPTPPLPLVTWGFQSITSSLHPVSSDKTGSGSSKKKAPSLSTIPPREGNIRRLHV